MRLNIKELFYNETARNEMARAHAVVTALQNADLELRRAGGRLFLCPRAVKQDGKKANTYTISCEGLDAKNVREILRQIGIDEVNKDSNASLGAALAFSSPELNFCRVYIDVWEGNHIDSKDVEAFKQLLLSRPMIEEY